MVERPATSWNHWWTCAPAATLSSWLIHHWSRPVYFVYGRGGNVYYRDNVVYAADALPVTADTYFLQARAIARSVPDLDEAAAASLEWLPLGVFAITRKGVAETNTYLQLSVTHEGIIGGTYFNEATGISRSIEGMVDMNSQRVAWMLIDGKNPDFVVETSFFNLSRDEVPVLVHFGSDRVQIGLLIRVKPPAED